MSSSSSWEQRLAAADGGAAAAATAAGEAAAAEGQPAAAAALPDAAVCADIAQRMQHADSFWQQLEAAAADVGPQRIKQFVATFKQAHDRKVQEVNLEQADHLASQIFAALQQQHN
ncbi:hypothetical protein, conserved [Eimeria brunetti]|uniref:Uncharacterized protein n=1 Tax=Eimeria brunetti TaxID=51314 RepID=U6LVM9_9EIME|nr:hypothetical protein, conserved [Eimeria brunetti]